MILFQCPAPPLRQVIVRTCVLTECVVTMRDSDIQLKLAIGTYYCIARWYSIYCSQNEERLSRSGWVLNL